MTGEKDAPAEMPGVEEIQFVLAQPLKDDDWIVEKARAILALFAPILAEKERAEPGYRISEPDDGWRVHGSFSADEKAKLRPIAETLAMLDGNAFFGNEAHAGAEWYEQYLPEAHALYEGNGGDKGWAGEASFAKAAAIRAEGE